MAIDQANGTTIAFGTSAWTPEVTDVGINQLREKLDKTTLADDSGGRRYMPSKLIDSEVTLEVQHDAADHPPLTGAVEEITITWALQSGESTAAKEVFDGFISQYNVTAAKGEIITASVTIAVDGGIDHTDAT